MVRFLALIALLLMPALAFAAGDKIVSISVQGNRYVESSTIIAKMHVRKGDRLNRANLAKDARRLYATGLFGNIQFIGDSVAGGLKLTVKVEENPLIAKVEIIGNEEVTVKDLRLKLKLKSGQVFNAVLAARDQNMIRKAYLKKGFYQVGIKVETKPLKDGRIDVAVRIHEGDETRIKQIRFIGNKVYSDEELRDKISSSESGFGSWISKRDVFDLPRVEGDGHMVEQYYQNNGYLDAAVESSLVSISSDKSWFYLTFGLFEGPRYLVESVDVQGDIIPDKETLMSEIALEAGKYYSLAQLRKSIEGITEKVGDQGYAFASVTPLFKRDVAARKVAIVFDIEKGREVYIHRVDITGNTKTADNVVRRELRQDEGSRYAASRIKYSRERLQRLSLFEDVRFSMPPADDPNQVDLKVDVADKKTGSFSIGAGYSQLERVFVTSKVQENNLFGRGYAGNLSAEVGARTQNYDISLTDPYFMGEDIRATIHTNKTQTKPDQMLANNYHQDSVGGGVSFGFPLSDHLTYSIGYEYSRTNLTNMPADASLILQSQAGRRSSGELTQSLAWDTRDNLMTPNSGHFEQLTFGYAGLGGSTNLTELRASTRSYFELAENVVLSPTLEGKYITAQRGKSLPVYRRYSMGGMGSLRGFEYSGVSLRDPATNEVVGGDKLARLSLDLFVPLPIRTPGFRGVLFADAGVVGGGNLTVGSTTFQVAQPMQLANTRVSVGFGVEWISPLAPISLVWGFPVRKMPGDISNKFEFALGSTF